MAGYLHLDSAPSIAVETRRKAQLAVTRLHSDTGLSEISTPIPAEKAFVVVLQLRDLGFHKLWFQGRPIPTGPCPEGSVSILDLEQEPTLFLPSPFHSLQFYASRTALDEIADDNGARRIETLSWPHGEADPVTRQLALSVLPALERPEQANRLFVDHVLYALNAHFAHAYGGMRSTPSNARGGLAPWQERRCKEIMRDSRDEHVSLAQLASECRLSRSYFARAFKRTTGQSPHRWLLVHRVESAKRMLATSDTPISEIALSAGFADQSHLTRVFSKVVGATPGAWRRAAKD